VEIDVNKDGPSDVITGAPYFDNLAADEGSTFTYHGAPSPIFLPILIGD
jgi:hypothetical protein